MSAVDDLIARLAPTVGTEIHVGEWLAVDQARIDRFAEATGDRQWIHTDPERAARESPYGAAVAHGFLTLSLVPFLTRGNDPETFREQYPGMTTRINYGLDRVRFPAPVAAGSRIRARTALKDVAKKGDAAQLLLGVTVEIEGKEKPACVAEMIVRVY